MENKMTVLVYEIEKQMTKGVFAGWTIVDTLTFVSASRAKSWMRDVNKNHARGVVNYHVNKITLIGTKERSNRN